MELSDKQKVAEKIRWHNSGLQGANITYTGWLKRETAGKRASSMVVEFDRPRDADHAIVYGLVSGAQLFSCEYYDRSCKLKQCFRCQKYGHIGTHCKAVETCSYCAGRHDSRGCEDKNRQPKPDAKCANCGGKHPTWSPHYPIRKEAYAQLDARGNSRPHTHGGGQPDRQAPKARWDPVGTADSSFPRLRATNQQQETRPSTQTNPEGAGN